MLLYATWSALDDSMVGTLFRDLCRRPQSRRKEAILSYEGLPHDEPPDQKLKPLVICFAVWSISSIKSVGCPTGSSFGQ